MPFGPTPIACPFEVKAVAGYLRTFIELFVHIIAADVLERRPQGDERLQTHQHKNHTTLIRSSLGPARPAWHRQHTVRQKAGMSGLQPREASAGETLAVSSRTGGAEIERSSNSCWTLAWYTPCPPSPAASPMDPHPVRPVPSRTRPGDLTSSRLPPLPSLNPPDTSWPLACVQPTNDTPRTIN